MPLYEYVCRRCSNRFESLILGSDRPACPGCRSEDLEKMFSTFAVGTGGGQAARAAEAPPEAAGPCGSCGDPRGPGSCAID